MSSMLQDLFASLHKTASVIFFRNKGCQNSTKYCLQSLIITFSDKKWCNILNIDISKNDWTNIYKICFKTLQRNYLVQFQYIIIHELLRHEAY